MQELLNLIPFLDIIIILLLLGALYIGWNQGLPRLAMVAGAIYTGFLLASIYYHLFAVMLINIFGMKDRFTADLISFAIVFVLVTIFMLALLLSLYGHVEIKGRAAVFDKIGGSVLAFVTAVFAAGILVTLLRVPYEANKKKVNAGADMPIVQVFNSSYERSALAPAFMRTTPLLMGSVTPWLPAETRQRGAVPLLESIISQR